MLSFGGSRVEPRRRPIRSVSCYGEGRSSENATEAMMELVRYGIIRLVQEAIVVMVDGLPLTYQAGLP